MHISSSYYEFYGYLRILRLRCYAFLWCNLFCITNVSHSIVEFMENSISRKVDYLNLREVIVPVNKLDINTYLRKKVFVQCLWLEFRIKFKNISFSIIKNIYEMFVPLCEQENSKLDQDGQDINVDDSMEKRHIQLRC